MSLPVVTVPFTSSETIHLNHVPCFNNLSSEKKEQITDIYCRAFANPPYCEFFSPEEGAKSLQALTEKGDLVVGSCDERIVSLAGGYLKPSGIYYVDELAVDPNEQGKGYGRKTLEALLMLTEGYPEKEIRTTSVNHRAISLYESFGFVKEKGLEIVAEFRQNGSIGLDERVYLAKPMMTEGLRYMKLKHMAVAYPSGNTTAVIFDQLLELDRKKLNKDIMSSWISQKNGFNEIEQCCFVTKPRNSNAVARVEMMGGEFCGNAARSVIALVTKGQDYEGLIEVSGVDDPLSFVVSKGQIRLQMPLPKEKSLVEEVEEGFLVHLDGITHLVVLGKNSTSPRELFNALKDENKYNCTSYPAFGVSFFDPETKNADFCVWVNAVDTVFDETACGSGTSSIGIALAKAKGQSVMESVIQPSQEAIMTIADYNLDSQKVDKSYIEGEVKILFDGEFSIS